MSKNILFFNNNQAELPNNEEVIANAKNFVLFGNGNDYPQRLFELYNKSSVFQSIIESIKFYIVGEGVKNNEITFNGEVFGCDSIISKKNDTANELIEKLVLDYLIFGAYALNVQRNTFGDIVYLNYVDVQKLRIDEDSKFAYYSSKWTKYSNKSVKYEIFNPKDSTQLSSIYYFKNPISRGVYGLPIYNSSLTDIMCSVKISEYNLNQLLNDFQGNTVVSFNNGVPDEDTKKEIERKINDKFAGSANAGKTIVTFAENQEQAPTITKVPEDGLADKFNNLEKVVTDNIYAAFRISPTLLGVQKDGGVFNSQDYKDSWCLYKKTFVSPMQRLIEKSLKKVGIVAEFNEINVDFGDVIGNV